MNGEGSLCLCLLLLVVGFGRRLERVSSRARSGTAMPSDFSSLFSADLDLRSSNSLYSKESVYDLLHKELQLPPCVEENSATMSQKSGGETGSPTRTALSSGSSCDAMYSVFVGLASDDSSRQLKTMDRINLAQKVNGGPEIIHIDVDATTSIVTS